MVVLRREVVAKGRAQKSYVIPLNSTLRTCHTNTLRLPYLREAGDNARSKK